MGQSCYDLLGIEARVQWHLIEMSSLNNAITDVSKDSQDR